MNPSTFWSAPNGAPELKIKIALALLVGFIVAFAISKTPPPLRKYVVGAVTFVSGLFYVVFWLFPAPIGRNPDDLPRNAVESFSFFITDSQAVVANFTNIIAGMLIGLGIYSLLRIHLKRIVKQQKDWFFSATLVTSLLAMASFGYADYYQRSLPTGAKLSFIASPEWGLAQYGRDFLFDGFLQQMDAAMFSLIAFYIMSAAYRAFRARSAEATILLVTSLIVMFSLMGLVESLWNQPIAALSGGHADSFWNNLKLTEIAGWLKSTVQVPAIRGIDFGVGVGLLAMGLRIWLSLESIGGEA